MTIKKVTIELTHDEVLSICSICYEADKVRSNNELHWASDDEVKKYKKFFYDLLTKM